MYFVEYWMLERSNCCARAGFGDEMKTHTSNTRRTHLPNLLAMVPPLKPPTMPPMANIDTAIEYKIFTCSSGMSSPKRSLYTSFMKFSMFWKKTILVSTFDIHEILDLILQVTFIRNLKLVNIYWAVNCIIQKFCFVQLFTFANENINTNF
jgi:hypothetical protein